MLAERKARFRTAEFVPIPSVVLFVQQCTSNKTTFTGLPIWFLPVKSELRV